MNETDLYILIIQVMEHKNNLIKQWVEEALEYTRYETRA